MSGTAPGRVTRRWPCKGCRIEIGQTYLAKTQEHDSDWFPHYCRECEVNIRVEELAAEELAEQLEEIAAEAQKRFAAPEIEQRIRDGAAADLEKELPREVDRFCALRRPQLESDHADLEWNRIVAEVEAEKKAECLERLKKEGQ